MFDSVSVDVAIIGAGSAGLTSRRSAKKAGATVAMIDPGPFGTTCARVGCMPSKLLIAAADAAHHVREAGRFGVRVERHTVDGPAVMQRVQRERDRFVGFVVKAIETARGLGELIEGRAHVTGPGQLEVDGGPSVSFKSLIVATGGTPFIPPPFRNAGEALLTNESVFEMSDLPESLLVIGLGVIGLELGQAMHRLGVRTSLLGVGGRIGPINDPEIRAVAAEVFRAELDLHPTYELKQFEPVDGGVRIHFVDSMGRDRTEAFEKVLVAAGRRPNLRGLGLENAGVEPDERGRYPINSGTLQMADAPIFAAGDVNEFHPLLHEAADDGYIAGRNAARYPDVEPGERRVPMGIAFTDPQIGIIGGGCPVVNSTEAAVGVASYADQGRARVQGINQGKVRIYAEHRTGKLLGAELFGPRVEHLTHLLAWAVQQEMTVAQALSMPFYHPVLEEGIRTALRDLSRNLKAQGPPVECRVSEWGVGT